MNLQEGYQKTRDHLFSCFHLMKGSWPDRPFHWRLSDLLRFLQTQELDIHGRAFLSCLTAPHKWPHVHWWSLQSGLLEQLCFTGSWKPLKMKSLFFSPSSDDFAVPFWWWKHPGDAPVISLDGKLPQAKTEICAHADLITICEQQHC